MVYGNRKRDPPIWIAADFECMNVPINDNDNDHVTDKLFRNKLVAIGYNLLKNPENENLNLEKDGYINDFGEDCVEWFINEMLEIEGDMKNNFKIELGINLDTIPEIYHQTTCLLCEKEFKFKDLKENPVVKDHCHLTGRFSGLVHKSSNLNT